MKNNIIIWKLNIWSNDIPKSTSIGILRKFSYLNVICRRSSGQTAHRKLVFFFLKWGSSIDNNFSNVFIPIRWNCWNFSGYLCRFLFRMKMSCFGCFRLRGCTQKFLVFLFFALCIRVKSKTSSSSDDNWVLFFARHIWKS